MPLREINLVIHFLGFGLFVMLLIAGFMVERQYRKAPNTQAKATILGVARSMALFGPVSILIMLLTGIGNMHFIGVGLFDFGWLTAKVIFFAIAATNGLIFGMRSRKRGALIMQMVKGEATPDAETTLKQFDKQQSLFFFVNGIMLLVIVSLSVYGRLGGQ